MTDTAPDAAIQIAYQALWDTGELSASAVDDVAQAVCDALARAGWLHEPRRVEALEHIAETAQAYRATPYDATWSAFLCALDHFDTLTPATAEDQP